MYTRKIRIIALIGLLLLLNVGQGMADSGSAGAPVAPLFPLGTGFTYQGQLKNSAGSPLTATCNFKFSLWDGGLPHFGSQIGTEVTLLGASVVNGYFTVLVNSGGEFGADAFNGEERWLRVAVQCGSDAVYTTLSPRQLLTATPYAKYASAAGGAPWSGLSGIPAGFADNTDNNTTYSAGNGLILTETTFNLNFAGSGSASTAARSDHDHWGGTWSGAGTGLSLNSSNNTGLSANGPIYGVYGQSGTPGGVGGFFYNLSSGVGVHAQSASGIPLEAYVGSVRKFYVDASGNAYASGDTPLLPRSLAPAATNLVTVDSSIADTGWVPSITVGTDGLGLISYWDLTNRDLRVAHCSNAACSTVTTTTLDSTGDVGAVSSISIGADGLALISYYDQTNGDLKVAHCSNVACTSSAIASLDTVGNVGLYTSITIGADGLGLISYFDVNNGDLRVAHCSNTVCSTATITTLDTVGNVGWYTSITVGVDGYGLIAFFDGSDGDLEVAHCLNVTCSLAGLAWLDTSGDVGRSPSITIGTDGLGIISYYSLSTRSLKAAHCSNTACNAATLVSVEDDALDTGNMNAITIGADGLPLIVFYDGTNGDLRVAHCTNAFCVPYLRRR